MRAKLFKNKLGVIKKAEVVLKLLQGHTAIEDIYPRLNAFQMQDLRDYLEQQVVHFSALRDETPLTLAEIKSKLEPIPNYYYKQDCREPMDACFNETCIASYPGCFSNKMKTQLKVILEMLREYTQSPAKA